MKQLFGLILATAMTVQGHFALAQTKKNDTVMHEKFLGLRTCIYMVPDLQEAKKWYTSAFGVEPYFDEPYYIGFNIGGFELGLLPEIGDRPAAPDNVRTYWGVENVKEAYESLLQLGATAHEEPHSVGDPLVVATVRDPWGNLIGLIYNPVFKVEE